MAVVSVRTYQRVAAPSTSAPAGRWAHVGVTSWPIRVALWPFISAFVVRRPYGTPTLVTVCTETTLLLENVNWRPRVGLSWNQASMACPSHMSRFLTESLGLCIAIESASTHRWTPLHAIWDADRLPAKHPMRVKTGTRPDFIVQSNVGWHAIEARARGARWPVRKGRPVAAQKPKLAGMDDWSQKVSGHPRVGSPPSWSTTWAWITAGATWVDHFDPGQPVALSDRDEQAVWRRMADAASALLNVDDPRVRRVRALDRPMTVMSRPILDGDRNRPAWLTVASWTERLTGQELLARRRDSGRWSALDDAARGRSDILAQSTMGAFMATAVTGFEPSDDDLPELMGVIVDRSGDAEPGEENAQHG